MFSEGHLKPGGQREGKCRRKRRPLQTLLVPGNQFLPGSFCQPEPIDHEDGELTGLEVTTDTSSTWLEIAFFHLNFHLLVPLNNCRNKLSYGHQSKVWTHKEIWRPEFSCRTSHFVMRQKLQRTEWAGTQRFDASWIPVELPGQLDIQLFFLQSESQ